MTCGWNNVLGIISHSGQQRIEACMGRVCLMPTQPGAGKAATLSHMQRVWHFRLHEKLLACSPAAYQPLIHLYAG
jgi:hypothetical protein